MQTKTSILYDRSTADILVYQLYSTYIGPFPSFLETMVHLGQYTGQTNLAGGKPEKTIARYVLSYTLLLYHGTQ